MYPGAYLDDFLEDYRRPRQVHYMHSKGFQLEVWRLLLGFLSECGDERYVRPSLVISRMDQVLNWPSYWWNIWEYNPICEKSPRYHLYRRYRGDWPWEVPQTDFNHCEHLAFLELRVKNRSFSSSLMLQIVCAPPFSWRHTSHSIKRTHWCFLPSSFYL